MNCKEVRGLKSTRRFLLLGASAVVLMASMPAYAIDADALPSGGEVVGGSANFDYSTANELHINQHSERVVIDWESFNIGSDALTEFHQNSSNALAVNRVTGEGLDPTQILGQLKANGRVLVLDRNGVIFGEGAVVDVGAIVVSTGDVDTNAIMGGGNIEITNIEGDGFILNEGLINVSEAGLAAFVAPTVVNNGIINAKLGRVQIGAGSKATIDLYGDGLMELELDAAAQQTLINNGIILAEGGSVQIQAAAAKDIVDNLIVNTGIIAADSVSESNGTITLYAEGGTTYNDGYISAAGYQGEETGGNIEVLGDAVILDNNTLLDASGDTGGGDIKIGGDYLGTGDTPTAKYTYVAGGALILNDAITNGDGGRTIVWSDDTTEFYGSIYGRGGSESGNGGFVETSGKINLLAQGYVDLTAANGDKGTYLLDPADITIYGNFDPTDVAGLQLWLDANDLNAQLDGSNVTAWADKSGNGNDATAIGGREPEYYSNQLNGNSVVRFTENNIDEIAGSLGGGSLTEASIFTLGKFSQTNQPANDYDYMYSIGNVAADVISISRTAGNYGSGVDRYYSYTEGSVRLGPTLDTNYKIFTQHFGASAPYHALQLNGASQTVDAHNAQINVNASYTLGRWIGGSLHYLEGDIGEVIIYDQALSSTNVELINQYQSAKWGVALDPLAGVGTEAAEAMDATNGFGAFTTRYLERLSDTADIVLQAGNSITLDLQGDNLSLSAGRNISLVTGAGDIDIASAGTITTGGGDVTFTTGGTGNINVNAALTLNAVGGGDLNFVSGGVTNNVGNVTVTEGTRLGDLYIAPSNTSPPIPPSVDNVISNPSGQISGSSGGGASGSGDSDDQDLMQSAAETKDGQVGTNGADCLVSMDGTGCVVQ